MHSHTTVTDWLRGLKRGSDEAAQRIWQRYYEQLLGIAKQRLGNVPRRAWDNDDVVQEAFASLFQGVKERRFPRLDDRDDLWQLLLMLTDRRAKDQMRKELAEKRGRGAVRGSSVLQPPGASSEACRGLDALKGYEPTPETVDALIDYLRLKWSTFQDEQLMAVGVSKLMGYSILEIAQRTKLTPRAVERKLRLIRRLLTEESQ